jgi:hypothetical protein
VFKKCINISISFFVGRRLASWGFRRTGVSLKVNRVVGVSVGIFL